MCLYLFTCLFIDCLFILYNSICLSLEGAPIEVLSFLSIYYIATWSFREYLPGIVMYLLC